MPLLDRSKWSPRAATTGTEDAAQLNLAQGAPASSGRVTLPDSRRASWPQSRGRNPARTDLAQHDRRISRLAPASRENPRVRFSLGRLQRRSFFVDEVMPVGEHKPRSVSGSPSVDLPHPRHRRRPGALTGRACPPTPGATGSSTLGLTHLQFEVLLTAARTSAKPEPLRVGLPAGSSSDSECPMPPRSP